MSPEPGSFMRKTMGIFQPHGGSTNQGSGSKLLNHFHVAEFLYPSKVKMVLNASKWINSSIGIHIQLKNALQSTSWGFRVTSPKSVLIPLGFSKVPNFVRPSTGLEL